MASIEQKVAVVGGAGSVAAGIGNGRAISIVLSREGADIGAVDISPDSAEETRRMLDRADSSIAVGADVSTPEGAAYAVGKVVERFGRVDILVNVVGIVGPPGTAVDADPDEWDRVMRVNVKSMMLMAKYCLPHMGRAGGGAIVNIASTAGLLGGAPNLAYPTSKGAVVNMTRAMAFHHARAGVRVNCVAPGLVFTPRIEERGLTTEEREKRRLSVPLQTEGTPWDVANAVLFLVSDAARWVTGTVLVVDGGRTAAWPSS